MTEIPTQSPRKAIEPRQSVKKQDTEAKYRLAFRKPNGHVRGDISSSVLHQASRDYADLIQVIPSFKWMTIEEIVEAVWAWEKKNNRITYNRTRVAIESGVLWLINATIVEKQS